MRYDRTITAALIGLSTTGARADVVVTVSAAPTDTVINWSVTGVATMSVDTVEDSTGLARYPDADGSWNDLLQNPIAGIAVNVDQDDLAATGTYSVSVGGMDISRAIGGASFQTGRSVRLNLADPFVWPAFSAGTEITINGSGTFTLDSSTFASVFNLGDYTLTGN
ncbi:MAG: hypothetical protein AAF937_06650 [Planctomycetota bacterium]